MKTVWYFVKPYKCLLFLALLFVTMDVFGALVIPTITADMINIGIQTGNMGYILEKGIEMILATVFSGISALIGSSLCARLSAKIGRDMRNALYEKSLSFSLSDFEQFGTGSMITRTLNDVAIIQQAIVWCIMMVLPVPALSLLGILMAFSIDPSMGMLLAGAVLFVVLLALLISKKAAVIFEKMQYFLDRMNVVLRENITGVRVIRAFHKEEYEKGRLKKAFLDYAEAAMKTNKLFAALDSFSFFAINILIVLIVWLGGNKIGQGNMEIGDITALTEYTILILFYLIMAQMVLFLLPRAGVCLERMEAVLRYQPEITDETVQEAGDTEEKEFSVSIKKGSFRFRNADEDTLKELNFSCRKGKTTAIIGGTGSGKSTIAKLLLRFHEATEGAVLLGGKDIRAISQKNIRERIAYVPQKAWLFSGTIEENLRYGKEDATENEMLHALEVAQAGFVKELEDGLLHKVAQGGTNFSGGQRQRLAIARALMKKADLYIFDDSFSALDFKTDLALRQSLKREMKDSAVLIIAQRIHTIRSADQIIVLHNGKIAGKGTHEELMGTCAVYQEIARSQMKGGEKAWKKN